MTGGASGNPVLFLFKSGRRSRLEAGGPREFFYGHTEMAARGIDAEFLEIGATPRGPIGRLAEKMATAILAPLAGLNADTLVRLTEGPILVRLNRARALVATTNALGLALGALKTFGIVSPPVLFLPMGIWPTDLGAMRRRLLTRWLAPLALAPLSRTEELWLRSCLGREREIEYLPFGIDTEYWTPGDRHTTGDGALAIGNDRHRDWATLAAAWTPELPALTIITRRPVPASAGPISVVSGDWNQQPISDTAVRDFYRQAKFVVLPLCDTIQPSGQSACLQAMACGKAVVLSRIAGLWDDELLKDGETCLLVPPGDPQALNRTARRLAADPAFAHRLGMAASSVVRRRFSLTRMGDAVAARLQALTIDSSGRP